LRFPLFADVCPGHCQISVKVLCHLASRFF
jgi:hypothetical protein